MLLRDRKDLKSVMMMGEGCGQRYTIHGEGMVDDIFRGIISVGKKVFSSLKLKELASATGRSLVKSGKEFLKKDVAPALKRGAKKIAVSGIEEGVNRIVSRVEGKSRQNKDLLEEAQTLSKAELDKLAQRVREIAKKEGQKTKSRLQASLDNLGRVERTFEEIEDDEMYGDGLIRLGSSRPSKPRRKRGRPRKRN